MIHTKIVIERNNEQATRDTRILTVDWMCFVVLLAMNIFIRIAKLNLGP
jgi:hypothetical protein